jgi:hypothetical protein
MTDHAWALSTAALRRAQGFRDVEVRSFFDFQKTVWYVTYKQPLRTR